MTNKLYFKLMKALLIVFLSMTLSAQNLVLDKINNSIEDYGINVQFNYTGEVFSNLSGGLYRKSIYLDNFDLIFDLDLNRSFGWNGAIINTHILGNNGGPLSKYCGAIQGISNIEANNTWKLYEFFIEQHLFDKKLSLLLGLFDLNSEFDTRETSSIFINPSHGIGAEFALTGENGPSIFPTTSVALRAKYNFSNSLDFKLAIFDGIPGDLNNPNGTKVILSRGDGFLISSEINLLSNSQNFENGYFKFALGTWFYTNKFNKLISSDNPDNPFPKTRNYGFYLSAEKFLFAENNVTNQGLAAFIRIGFADTKVNQVDGYYGVGINYVGLITGRDEDICGISIAASHNSSSYRQLIINKGLSRIIEEYEYIFELTYKFSLLEFLTIQPDLQYVINPSLCINNDHTIAFGTRLQVLF
ncbi:MAG: carbohydrate porin [Ignavibacteriales bacterium]|nr:carbohydrate porin [Ignavibacteriota bacterium]MCB9249374.1 carbohydrate porin [Ignavibacteriales bacterium]